MAIAKTDTGIISIRGRFGGTYFKTTRGIIQQQAMPRHVYNTFGGTPPPYLHSSKFNRGQWINAWTNTAKMYAVFTAAILLLDWTTRTAQWLFPSGKAKGKKLAMRAWFMHFNTPRTIEGLPPYTAPPRGPTDLPDYTIVGQILGQHTINTYRSEQKYLDKYQYYDEALKWFVQWYDNRWNVTLYLGPELGSLYWHKAGEDPVGIYDPELPWQHTIQVNY